MQRLRHVLSALAAALFCCAYVEPSSAVERTASHREAMASITADELFEHVRVLASPAMDGRASGTPGGHAAADYIAGCFTRLQLQPAGTDKTFFQPFDTEKVSKLRNVLGMLPGSDPALCEEVIVVGAHYDHLGHGIGRMPRGPEFYPGAEDNASGVSTILELAEAFSKLEPAPKRSILFACWDGEEQGLLGSNHFVKHPLVPLDRIVAKLNYDMVGQLKDDQLLLHCSRSGIGLRRLLSTNNDDSNPLRLDFTWDYVKNSDHNPFCQSGIPSVFVITGSQNYAHSPRDTPDRINREGMVRVTRWSFSVLCDLANRITTPKFRAAALGETSQSCKGLFAEEFKPAERLGIVGSDAPPSSEGVRVLAVKAGWPAEEAGLRSNDCIVRFANREIRGKEDLIGAIQTALSPTSLTVRREGIEQAIELNAALRGDPMRWGIVGRVDDAEPGTLVLTYVLPGSPAATAGLAAGDRIYQINGQEFADAADFIDKARALPQPQLLVEREGRLRTVTLPERQRQPAKQAA